MRILITTLFAARPLLSSFAQTTDSTKFANLRVNGMQNTRLLIAGYEYQHAYAADFNSRSDNKSGNFTSKGRFRIMALVPIVNKKRYILTLTLSYTEHYFNASGSSSENTLSNSLYNSLLNNKLKSTGVTATQFFAFNSKTFILLNGGFEISNNLQHTFSDGMYYAKYNAAAFFGWRLSNNNL